MDSDGLRKTLNVKRFDEVYAIGDATDIPISKSGVVAHLECMLLSKNLERDITGSYEAREMYNGRINCPMELGSTKAIFMSGIYAKPPRNQYSSFVKYEMRRVFSRIYWSGMKGSWEWLFLPYFGKTSSSSQPEEILINPHEIKPLIGKW